MLTVARISSALITWMPKRAAPEPRKTAWRTPAGAGVANAAGGAGVGNGCGAGVAAGGRANGVAPPRGPRRLFSGEGRGTAVTTRHRGHPTLATPPNPRRGDVAA